MGCLIYMAICVAITAGVWSAYGWVPGVVVGVLLFSGWGIVIVVAGVSAPFKAVGWLTDRFRRVRGQDLFGAYGGVDKARERLSQAQNTPVAKWTRCPACRAGLPDGSVWPDPRLIRCGTCARFFADPGYMPDVDWKEGPNGLAKDWARFARSKDQQYLTMATPWTVLGMGTPLMWECTLDMELLPAQRQGT